MIVKHILSVTSVCPVDGLPDVYQVTVEAACVIEVERIIEVAQSFSTRRVFQEDLTQEMARRLAATVTSVGYHSGVRTEVTA